MHMHAHLVECIKDYRPVYAFWLFSFERYNGILGNYRTNNRSVEVQFMQHFMHDVQVDNLNIPVECLNVQTTTMQQLFNKDLSTGTLNDMCSEHGMEYCAVIACSKLSVYDVPTSISGPSVLPIVYQELHQSTTLMETVHCIWPMHIK